MSIFGICSILYDELYDPSILDPQNTGCISQLGMSNVIRTLNCSGIQY